MESVFERVAAWESNDVLEVKEEVDSNPVYTVSISQTSHFQDSMLVPVEVCGLGSCTVYKHGALERS